jgi:hypothetical protein
MGSAYPTLLARWPSAPYASALGRYDRTSQVSLQGFTAHYTSRHATVVEQQAAGISLWRMAQAGQ